MGRMAGRVFQKQISHCFQWPICMHLAEREAAASLPSRSVTFRKPAPLCRFGIHTLPRVSGTIHVRNMGWSMGWLDLFPD